MSFLAVRAAIKTRLLTISGVEVVVPGMPNAIHAVPPLFISEYQSGDRVGESAAFLWRFGLHAIISLEANAIAEDEIDAMVDAAFAAFSPKLNDSNGRPRSTLGGAAKNSWFEAARSGETDGYITFGNPPVVYRRIGFVLVVKTMEVY